MGTLRTPLPMTQRDPLPAGVVVATGASRGLGRGLLDHLLAIGRPVIAVVRHLPSTDHDQALLSFVEADLSTTSGIEAAIAAIRTALGPRPLAALVNGAGAVKPIGPLAGHSSATLLAAFTLMAVAPARLSTALADRIVPGGRVLNLSNRSATATFPGRSLYCLSKHALHSVSRSLQLELSRTVAVVELIPGEVDTGMQADPHGTGRGVHLLGVDADAVRDLRPGAALDHLRRQRAFPLAA